MKPKYPFIYYGYTHGVNKMKNNFHLLMATIMQMLVKEGVY